VKKRISKLLLVFLILFAGILSSCSRDNEILATSRIKNITRGDFHTWLDAKKVKKESILDSKKKQKKLLESMAVELFVMDKARAEGFDKSKKITIEKDRIRESTLNNYFTQTLMDTATYSKPAIRVSCILLKIDLFKQDPDNKNKRIRLEPEEVSKKYSELLFNAKDIIKKLDKGESFEKLASEFSGDSSKKNGGDLGYILKDMMPAYFTEPAFNLKKGEYTQTPVMTPKGIYIIKVTDRVELTEKNIDKIIEDNKQRDRMKSWILIQYKKDYLAALEKAKDVEFLYKEGEHYSNTDALFRIGTKEYTLADMEKALENRLTQDELKKIYINGVLPENIKLNFTEQYFKYLVFIREAVRLGIENKPEYLKELNEREINLIVAEYLDANLSEELNISDQVIKDEYEKDKDLKYTREVNENGVMVKKIVPFDAVKDEIIEELKNQKSGEQEAQIRVRAQTFKRHIFDEYGFKIDETKLKGA
jgi:hypothetical protein